MMGDRRRELGHLPALLAAGYAVASVEYRFSGEALFPAAVVEKQEGNLHATFLFNFFDEVRRKVPISK